MQPAERRAAIGAGFEALVAQPGVDAGRVAAIGYCLGGAADAMVPPDVRTLFEAQMNEAGVDWGMIVYGGVLHAFTVPGASGYGMPGLRYDRNADERSWRAMLDLFGESIGIPGSF